jgi:protein MpaA
LETFVFGKSTQNIPIFGHHFGSSGARVLILGGVHGNEPEGVIAAHGLMDKFHETFSFKLQVTLVPVFNPEGVFALQRVNSNGVDLNRNLPTTDWSPEAAKSDYNPGPSAGSEPENKALMEWITKNKPKLILSLHSWKPMLNINGQCQPEAQVISKITGYKIEESIGYPTPGCLGTYTGFERDIPTLTYEIERGLAANEIIRVHVPALIEALKVSESRLPA